MQLAIIPIGNSKGIRIPKALLEKYHLKDAVELELRENELVLKPVHNPREGWEDAFRQMHENGDDKLLLPDMFDDETWDEW